eukprot:1373796-Prorocentrum_lima.AAC.1
MTSSLVGSEMCIRDRAGNDPLLGRWPLGPNPGFCPHSQQGCHEGSSCLLYTSDAADDMQCGDL